MKKRTLLATICMCILAFVCMFAIGCKSTEEPPEEPSDNTKLSTPTDISISGNVVSWTSVTNADYYDVFIDDKYEATVSQTSYTIEITEKGEYKIAIGALSIGNRYEASDLSEPVTYTVMKTVLGTPEITIRGSKISWNVVKGATSYEIYVNETKVDNPMITMEDGVCTWLIDIEAEGIYAITVKAFSTNEDYLSEGGLSNSVSFKLLDKTVYYTATERVVYDNTEAAELTSVQWEVSNAALTAEKVLKVALYMTTGILDTNVNSRNIFYYNLKAQLVNAQGTSELCTFMKQNYYTIYDPANHNIIVGYVLKLPQSFNGATDKVKFSISAQTGMNFSVDKLVVAGAGYDLAIDNDYVVMDEIFAFEENAECGTTAVTKEDFTQSIISSEIMYFLAYQGSDFVGSGVGDQTDGALSAPSLVLGANCGGSNLFIPEQTMKLAIYLDVYNITDTNGKWTIYPIFWTWPANQIAGMGQVEIPYSDLIIGKNVVVVTFQILDSYISMTENYLSYNSFFGAGISGKIDKFAFAGADYDFGAQDEYYLAFEEASEGALAPTGSWTSSNQESEKPKDRPIITLDSETQTITWGAIENAVSYDICVNDGEPINVTETTYKFNYVNPFNYVIKVRAVYETSVGEYGPSVTLTVEDNTPKTSKLYDYNSYGEETFGSLTEEATIQGLTYVGTVDGSGAKLPTKIAWLITINSVPESNGYLKFHANGQVPNDAGWTSVVAGEVIIPQEDLVVGKKIIVVFVAQNSGDTAVYNGAQAFSPVLYLAPGMSVTLDNLVFAQGDYDFGVGEYAEGEYVDYVVTNEVECTGDMAPTKAWTASTKRIVLEKPVLTLDSSTKTITWNAIENAAGYDISVNDGEPINVTTTSYTISETTVGSYSVKVRAICVGNTGEYSDSVTLRIVEPKTEVTDCGYGEGTFGTAEAEAPISGLNYIVETGANRPIKVAYFITVNSMPETGYLKFFANAQLWINDGWAAVVPGEISIPKKDLVIGQKIVLIFVIQNSSDLAEDDGRSALCPQLIVSAGASVTLDNLVFAEGDYDFGTGTYTQGTYAEYTILFEKAQEGVLAPNVTWTPSTKISISED